MIRFVILAVVGYVAYRALKSWMFPNTSSSEPVAGKKVGEIDDVMVKDPFCNVYFARKKGIHQRVDGKDYFFCSTDCRDKYLELKTEAKQ